MAARSGKPVGIALYRVYSATQAAQVLGVDERSAVARAKRWAARGHKVHWTRTLAENPMGCTLIDADWVLARAAERDGARVEIPPSTVPLPPLATAKPVVETDEHDFRFQEMQRLLETTTQGATAAEIARLEAELARAKAEASRLRAAMASQLEITKGLVVEQPTVVG